jgi:TRF2-interacting telomeric protein/Rap1 - C terminal domain
VGRKRTSIPFLHSSSLSNILTARQFPHRTEREWRKFFMDQVLPIYRADQAKQSPFTSSSRQPASKPQQETPSNAQMGSLLSKPSHAAPQDTPSNAQIGSQLSTPPHIDHTVPPKPSEETDPQRSLSFRPDTPTIQPGSVSKSQKKAMSPDLNTTRTALEDEPLPAEPSHVQTSMTVPPRSPKRKPTMDEDDNELHQSTPLTRPRPYKKPRQHEGDNSEIREIPSTPDKPSDPLPTRTPSKVTPKTPSRYSHNTLFVDQEDESDEEAEILSPPIGAAVPSVSLSEPPPTPPPRPQEGLIYRPSPTRETQELAIGLSTTQEESAFETAPTQLFETAQSHPPQSVAQAQSETQTQPGSLDSEMIILNTPSRSHRKKQNSQESFRHQELDTQAILTTSIQIPDFTLAEPDGGWDAYESPSASQKVVNPNPPMLDDSIPSPPGGWQEPPAPTPPTQQPPPSNQSQVLSKPRFISDWITARTSDKLTPKQASEVLMSTSMDANLADVVLGYLRLGQNVPPLRGVWTKEDDADLQGQDGRGIKRLLKKHGDEGVERRWEFLEMWRNS